jgi:hypothetical protein
VLFVAAPLHQEAKPKSIVRVIVIGFQCAITIQANEQLFLGSTKAARVRAEYKRAIASPKKP